jgi:uncharacterized protein YdbL (DUF1318 family)
MIYFYIAFAFTVLYAATITGAYIESRRDEKRLEEEINLHMDNLKAQEEYTELLEAINNELRYSYSDLEIFNKIQAETIKELNAKNRQLSNQNNMLRKALENISRR